MSGLTGVSYGAEPSRGPVRVTLQLKWRHQFQFAGYYAAIRQGYYHDAGLAVDLVEAMPGQDPVTAVLDGRAEFGVGTSELLVLRGQGEPVVVLAAIFQHSPLVLLAGKTDRTTDLQTLHDQPIMLEPQSAELLAYFKNEGIDPNSLKIVHHTFEVTDLIEGRVAAMSAYVTDEPFTLRRAGIDYMIFNPRAGGIDFYGDSLFTTEEQLRMHPERVRKFRAASLKGWEYAMAHPEEIIDHILSNYRSAADRAHLEFEAEQMKLLMHPGLIEIGYTNPGRWRHMAETYAEFGMLPRNFDLDGFLYDPNPRPDFRWAYWTIGVIATVALAAWGWVLPLRRINQKLKRAKDEAVSADDAKGRYLAFMTHELRTPLNGILGVIHLLRDSGLNREQQQNLELLEHAAQNQMRLIDGVLDYAKLEAGRLELERLTVALPEFVHEVGGLFNAVARSKGISLVTEIAAGVPEQVVLDPTRLRQVLGNLLGNAVKFTITGEVRLTVDQTAEAGMRALRFTVKDTGIGMDEAALARVFTPYVQGTASVSREFGGTGLGLAIARQLIEAMGGGITVTSQVGDGTTFAVSLPLEPAANGETLPS